MKKILIGIVLVFISNLFADLTNDGYVQYTKGNCIKAEKLWKMACNSGLSDGCYNLGYLYENGQNVKEDYKRALKFQDKASYRFILYNGIGQKYKEAKRFYAIACYLRDSDGCVGYIDLIRYRSRY